MGETVEEADGWMFRQLREKYPPSDGYTYSGNMGIMADADVRFIAVEVLGAGTVL